MEKFLKLFPVLEVEEAVNCVHLMLIKKKREDYVLLLATHICISDFSFHLCNLKLFNIEGHRDES